MCPEKSEYLKYRFANVINVQKLVTLNYYEVENDFKYKGEKHNFWEMIYVDKGELIVETDSETISLSNGECLFHKPNEFHSHRANGIKAPNYFVICFVCNSVNMKALSKKIFKLTEKQKKFISNIIAETDQVFDMSWNSLEENQLKVSEDEPFGGQQLIKSYLEQLLIFLLRQESGKVDSLKGQLAEGENMAINIRQQLDTYVYKDFTVEDFCREMRYSKSYLSKVFIKEYGDTIYNYVTILKMREAKRLIRERVYNFTEISDMLCYSNPLYFSKVFKRIWGMTPSEYKSSVTSRG